MIPQPIKGKSGSAGTGRTNPEWCHIADKAFGSVNNLPRRLNAVVVSVEVEVEVAVEKLDCALAKRRALALWVEGLLDS